jgi:hypothetical protein
VNGDNTNDVASIANPPSALVAAFGGSGLLNRIRTLGLPAIGNEAMPPLKQGGKTT